MFAGAVVHGLEKRLRHFRVTKFKNNKGGQLVVPQKQATKTNQHRSNLNQAVDQILGVVKDRNSASRNTFSKGLSVGRTQSGYAWRGGGDGNIFGDYEDVSALNSSDYNVTYSIIGQANWPVPRPSVNNESVGIPYASVVGSFAYSHTITSGANPMYVYITINPTDKFPMAVGYGDGAVRAARDTFHNQTFSTWVVTDPRLPITGNSAQSQQQFMGGDFRMSFSVPFDVTAAMSVLDPMLQPTVVGNKAGLHILPGTPGHQPEVSFNISGNDTCLLSDLFNYGTHRQILNGASGSSTVELSTRLIPNTADWEMIRPTTASYASAFGGFPVYCIMVPPQKSVSISAAGWVAYNVQVNPLSDVGQLLTGSCPITTPFATQVKNTPMTVVTSKNHQCSSSAYGFSVAEAPNPSHQAMSVSAPTAQPGIMVRAVKGLVQRAVSAFRSPTGQAFVSKAKDSLKNLLSHFVMQAGQKLIGM